MARRPGARPWQRRDRNPPDITKRGHADAHVVGWVHRRRTGRLHPLGRAIRFFLREARGSLENVGPIARFLDPATMLKLGVNIDHVATIREARYKGLGRGEP